MGAALVIATGCAPAQPAKPPRTELRLVPDDQLRADVRQDSSKLSIRIERLCKRYSFVYHDRAPREPRRFSVPLLAGSAPFLAAGIPLVAVSFNFTGADRTRFLASGIGAVVTGLLFIGFAFVPRSKTVLQEEVEDDLRKQTAPGELVAAGVPCGDAGSKTARISVRWPDGRSVDIGSTDEQGRLDVDLAPKVQVVPADGRVGMYADGGWIGIVRPWDPVPR